MKLEQAFEVQAPIEQVWEALIDLERVAPCLPGATITGHDEDGTYHGEFKVKLGPTTAAKTISGFSLFFGARWDRLKRIFGGGKRR